MTRSKLQRLLLLLGACSAGFAFAGAGDITKRDQGGSSVELTNMGEEDAPVVVAVPAQASLAPSAPVAAERPASVRPAVQRAKRLRDKDEEEIADSEQAGETGEQRAEQSAGTGQSDWGRSESFATNSGFAGNYGFGAPTYSSSTGSTAGTGSTGGANAGTDSSVGVGAGGGSAQNGNGTTTSPGGTPPAPAGDSPARWANYQQIMVNEPRGSNGLVGNPAVQRRYLKTNRAGYMGLGY
ncbi:MAG: hypothetical protein HZA64_13925 [Rhodocyclales bacterium]|nr:hypothetical protein [Rhodocyclales bacterium]